MDDHHMPCQFQDSVLESEKMPWSLSQDIVKETLFQYDIQPKELEAVAAEEPTNQTCARKPQPDLKTGVPQNW